MKATEILMEEHRVIERVLNALERATNRLNKGDEVYLRFFTGTAVFIKQFTDECHHKKEEEAIIPAMLDHGVPKDTGPVAVILVEHEEGRRLAQAMRQATERFQAGDIRMRDTLVQSSKEYIRLIRQHIMKEDKVFYPLANKVIPPEQDEVLLKAYEQYDQDHSGEEIHTKYYGLAERLEKECLR